MPREDSHDFGWDGIDVWHKRLAGFVRSGGFWLDVVRGMFVVLAAALIGAVAGGVIGANFRPGGFWAATILSALLLGAAGWKVAKKAFFEDREERPADATGTNREALFAPHLPGVQEQFARARVREFVLSVVLIPSTLFLFYLIKAKPDWPLPGVLPRDQLVWATLAFIGLVFGLLALNGRCPACAHRITGLMKLRRCPFCGVAYRD